MTLIYSSTSELCEDSTMFPKLWGKMQLKVGVYRTEKLFNFA